jgi:ParB family chromosome partitioning protein
MDSQTASARPRSGADAQLALFVSPAGAVDVPMVVDLARLHPSPTNPRKTFDDIDELAQSIAEVGLLEPLLIRSHPKIKGDFEIVAGERRYRALKKNKAPTANAILKKLDDGETRVAQIVENLQRKNVPALEEAEGFLKLQNENPAKWTAAAIALKVGKDERVVQQRITIAKGLSTDFKEKFATGEINVEEARTLATFPEAVQKAIPRYAIEQGASRIREKAFEICVPETAASFEVSLYKGEFVEDAKKRRYFADVAQFVKLQKPAAEKKLDEIRKEWPNAKLVTLEAAKKDWYWSDQAYTYSHGGTAGEGQRPRDVPSKFFVPKEKSTAIVWIAANGEIRKALGVCTAADIEAQNRKHHAKNSARQTKTAVGEKADHKKARKAFNLALAKRACGTALALRLQLLNLAIVDYNGRRLSADKHKQLLPAALRSCVPAWNATDKDRAAGWRIIAKMPIPMVASTLAKLSLADPPCWEDFEWQQRPQFMVALAETLGVAVPAIALPAPPKAAPAPKAAKKKAAKKKHA